MITSFSLKNFKSYKEAEMPLATLTFFIGPNASGKSNALEAIRFLSLLSKGTRLDDIEKGIHGLDGYLRGESDNLFRDSGKALEIGCRMDGILWDWNRLCIQVGLISDHLVIKDESVSKKTNLGPLFLYRVDGPAKNAISDEVIQVRYYNFSEGEMPQIPCSDRQAIFFQLETPGRFREEDPESQFVIPSVAKSIRTNLRNVVFLEPHPEKMRGYSYLKDDVMMEDGNNLSSVLYKICNGDDRYKKDQMLKFVRSLPEQDIIEIRFIKTERNDVMVRLVESFGGKESVFDAPVLSDGTLRVLAVGATLLSAPQGSLVVIEEIDNGIHPSRAESLILQIKGIAEARGLRVLLTSHNPALLDAIPDESLGDVLCCYRDPELGDSRIVRLDDLDRFPELMAQGTLGELVTRQVLDRFLKDKTTPEERKQAALSWLMELKNGVKDECHLSD
ncbi:MAG: ATP-binding protein [Methanothrix sp.]|nr:ATP-binding protein [Methanothrix sp.]